MIVHLVYDVKCGTIAKQLTDVGVLLPHYFLEGGRDLLIVTLLGFKYVLDVRLFASESGQTFLKGSIGSLLGPHVFYVKGHFHVHLDLLQTLHALATFSLGEDPLSRERVERKVQQWNDLAQDLSSSWLINDLEL